jgi:hypothetical protein
MIPILGVEPRRTASLAGVLERAIAGGSPAPAWAAMEDPEGDWIRVAASSPPAERRKGVVAVASDEALVAAVRLGVGGALWLPPSLAGAVGALEAAAAAPQELGLPDSGLLELVASGSDELVAVGWANTLFWRWQVGEPEMAQLLAELAGALGVLPALLSWPALLLRAGPGAADIEAAWRRLTSDRHTLSQGIEVVRCDLRASRGQVVRAAVSALSERLPASADPAAWGYPRPVHELPSGRRVGWWSPAECPAGAGAGEWVAVAEEATGFGVRWRLSSGGGSVRRVMDWRAGEAVEGAALRVPGWLVGRMASGSPAGLLVERLAGVAQRNGLPLWVPSLRPGSLRFLLRLPATLWTDGAEVPSGD